MADDPVELARRAADEVEAALDRDTNEADLPEPIGPKLRAAVRILRETGESDVTDKERSDMLRTALAQLLTPPGVFLPHDVNRATETARFLIGRAMNLG
jgi:hypothetical protein